MGGAALEEQCGRSSARVAALEVQCEWSRVRGDDSSEEGAGRSGPN